MKFITTCSGLLLLIVSCSAFSEGKIAITCATFGDGNQSVNIKEHLDHCNGRQSCQITITKEQLGLDHDPKPGYHKRADIDFSCQFKDGEAISEHRVQIEEYATGMLTCDGQQKSYISDDAVMQHLTAKYIKVLLATAVVPIILWTAVRTLNRNAY